MIRAALLCAAVLSVLTQPGQAQVFSADGFAADAYGRPQGYPVPGSSRDLGTTNMVGFYSHYDRIGRMHDVATAGAPSPLLRAEHELSVTYAYKAHQTSITDYLDRNPVTGLLVARDDTILFEHYQYGRTDQDRFLSQSMAKTITMMLVGIALSEGAIRSIDDPAAAYVPELAGTEYGKTPLRALLHMSSGVTFRETYTNGDDNQKLGRALNNPAGAVAAVSQFNTRDAAPGTRWYYSGAETEILGLIVSRAVHMTLAEYLSQRIWQKMGMEAPAAWASDAAGQEIAYCCFVATLRDWARLGLMLAHDGAWNGQQIVPKQWLLDATTVAPGEDYLAPGKIYGFWGYGFQVWLYPAGRRMFVLMGIHGQRMFVDPQSKLVMVQTAVFPSPGGGSLAEALALWDAVVVGYGGGDLPRPQ